MIEAINSAVANATLVRGNAGQVSNASSISKLQELQKVEMPLAPYVSLFVQMNNEYNKAVLQIRDSDTGDVQNQFPSETTMRARAAQAEIETQSVRNLVREASSEDNSNNSAPSVNIPSAEIIVSGQSSESNTRVAEAQIASATFSAQALAQNPVSGSVSLVA
ncbi:MAG: hypothetical protein ACLFR0_00035 [Alphaproteobacteria bacterium]